MKIFLIGHLTIDIKRWTSPMPREEIALGGPPSYSAISLKHLGYNARIISKIGSNFPSKLLDVLNRAKIDLSFVRREGNTSTSFEFTYGHGSRTLRLISKAAPIDHTQFKDKLGNQDIAIVSPVINEISSSTINEIFKAVPNVAIDPQGFCRKYGKDGIVYLQKPEKNILKNIRKAHILKPGRKEAEILTGNPDPAQSVKILRGKGNQIVCVTDGAKGLYLSCSEGDYYIPAIQTEVVDETGAGDVFLSSLASKYTESGQIIESVCFASAVSSFLISSRGVEGVPRNKAAIQKRARKILQKVSSLEDYAPGAFSLKS